LVDIITILVAEDDQLIQVMVEEALSDGAFESTITASGEEARAHHLGNGLAVRARGDRIQSYWLRCVSPQLAPKRTWRSGHEMSANRSKADIAEGRLDVGF
jgi:hypothetical protein